MQHLNKFNVTLEDAGIGTFENIATVTYDTPLIEALHLLTELKISALPIVDDKGVALDTYCRSDTRFLATDETCDNLDMTLKDALKLHRHERPLPTCLVTDALWTVCKRLVVTNRHVLLVVEETSGEILGIVTLTDVYVFLLGQEDNKGDEGDEGEDLEGDEGEGEEGDYPLTDEEDLLVEDMENVNL